MNDLSSDHGRVRPLDYSSRIQVAGTGIQDRGYRLRGRSVSRYKSAETHERMSQYLGFHVTASTYSRILRHVGPAGTVSDFVRFAVEQAIAPAQTDSTDSTDSDERA
jgi:hypothetical protein